MEKLIVIDGNSILNRAFYGIMGSKMLTTKDGTYTNAVYGFLAILFKIMEDINPQYLAVAFDLKAPTQRHKLYEGYKATRKGMPNELAEQMPILKEILETMHIQIIELEGYEADDVLGTLAVLGEKKGLEVTLLSGDRDTFQLASDQVTIRIPRTKMGKTEVENFDRAKVQEIYGVEPKQLIEVKGLQGDTSDNIPGVPGIGEKTALSLIQQYQSLDRLYKKLDKGEAEVRGKAKENLIAYREQAFLSRELGTIILKAPIPCKIQDLKIQEWDKPKLYDLFKELNFHRYIERFHLEEERQMETREEKELFTIVEKTPEQILEEIRKEGKLFFYTDKKEEKREGNIISKVIYAISIFLPNSKQVVTIKDNKDFLKTIFEEETIEKYGHQLAIEYILLKQLGIQPTNLVYDAEIAAYDLNATNTKYHLEELAEQYLALNMGEYLEKLGIKKTQEQMNLFQEVEEEKIDEFETYQNALSSYVIYALYEVTIAKLKEVNEIDLFQNMEMPLVEVLAEMQWKGMYVDKEQLTEFGTELKGQIARLTKEIHTLAEEEFNINSTKQLGEVLFEKLKLPVYKKTKSGYSTDVDVLEKLKGEHPIIEKILEYRSLAKLNSTYVEGLIPYINPKTERIHSYFHQTITATGRISSTEPNLQNIPTRIELGKRLRKVFKPEKGYIFIDADYSQIELRVLAHISQDEHMIQAFLHDEDIHQQAASKVFNIPMDQVSKSQRSQAKAVNFGIVYGISDFGLAEQIGVPKKVAKQYIEQYLEKYAGIKKFMEDIVEQAKQDGYVETLFHRRRYIPELKSNSYIVRQFGMRAAMNTPIQGTAADIMKIAMIQVHEELKKRNLNSRLVLQIHDELLIEADKQEKEEVKEILKRCMENAIQLCVPLGADMSEAMSWYETK